MDTERVQADDVIAEGKERLAHVDDDGVTFRSHLDGSTHRFTPELSMRIQHQLGADIIFAFDELTTLVNTRGYQERSVQRTHRLGGALPRRAPAPDDEQARQAAAGTVRRGAGRSVRGPAAGRGARPDHDHRTPTAAASTATASAARWRSRTSRRSSAGSSRSCPTTNRGTCSASASPTTCSRPSPPGRTRSTACPRRASRATPRCTRRRGGSTSPGRGTAATSRRSTPSATATPVRTTPGHTCITCSRAKRSWRRRWPRSTTAVCDQAGRPDPRSHLRGRVRRTPRTRSGPVLLDACTIRR